MSEATTVTAGLGGFLVLFGLAVACWFLFRSMNSHLRGVRYQQEQEEAARAQPSEATSSEPPTDDVSQ